MTFFALSLFASLNIALVSAQNPTTSALTPLVSRRFAFDQLPYQVTGDNGGIRGPQSGYNICNSTTEGSSSKCQTLIMNSLDDFCLWSSDQQGSTDTIGAGEAREVSWCSKKGHGGRIIPPGAITGLQWLYAKNYIQLVGFLDQTKVGLDASDQGGELDPHGADGQGNPLGGVVYTNAFGVTADKYASSLSTNTSASSATTEQTQVIEWIDFIGNGLFCLKMCNPSDPNAPNLCQHVYDVIGCNYNALANYGAINGTYTVCDSDDMTPPGVFTQANGQVTTWFQPQTGPVIPPYTTTIPASSNCHTFSSQQLFATAAATTTSSSTTATGTGGSSTGTKSTGTGGASQTGKPSSAVPMPRGGFPLLVVVSTTILTTVITLFA